jgi:hypothetical protein
MIEIKWNDISGLPHAETASLQQAAARFGELWLDSMGMHVRDFAELRAVSEALHVAYAEEIVGSEDIRIHFANKHTIRMCRHSFRNGNWIDAGRREVRATDPRLISAVHGLPNMPSDHDAGEALNPAYRKVY